MAQLGFGMVWLFARAVVLASVPAALAAQAPAGWTRSVVEGAETYLKGDAVTEALVMAKELPAASPADVETVTTRLFASMGCRGAPPPARDGAIASFGEGNRCFATFAPSAGGYRVAIGLATPGAEAEAKDLARQLTGAEKAAVGPAVDAKAVNAALAAALDAVPARNLPVHMAMRQGFRYDGTNINVDYRLWMLFADGFATTCTDWDPATTVPTEAGLAAVVEKTACLTGRWRRKGTGAVFDDGPDDEPSPMEDDAPPKRGTTYQGEFDGSEVKFSMFGIRQYGTVLMDTSKMSLTRDGEFWFGTDRLNRASANSTTTRRTMGGRYLVDRYLMAIAVDGRIERHFFHALGKPEDKELILYFDGRLLSNR